jgi:hypothetical protein
MAKRKAGSQIGNWLSTTKNWESPQFPRVKVACNILLETSRWGLQLFLRPHLNRRFARKVMGPQSCKSLNCENFHLGVPRQNDIWVLVLWLGIERTIRGKALASPKFGLCWILWIKVCPWFILTPKALQLCTNQLVVWFCASPGEWVISYHSS